MPVVQGNCTLTSLDLFRNDLGPEGAVVISNILKVASHTRWTALLHLLGQQVNCKLTILNLFFNNIGFGAAISEALRVAIGIDGGRRH